jgi:hypothetical protein
VVLWDLQKGKKLRKLTGGGPLAFSADGTLLAVSDALIRTSTRISFIRLYDVASGKEVRQIHSPILGHVCSLAFSPDRRTLAAYQGNGTVLVLWEVASGKERARLMEVEEWGANSLAFSPDGRTLAAGDSKNTVRLYDVATGQELHRLQGHRGHVISLFFSADGKCLVSSSQDTSVLVWDLTRVLADKPRVRGRLSPKDLEVLWTDLASDEAARAYKAQAKLTRAPKETLAFLKERLHPVAEPDLKGLSGLLADLDADEFTVRGKAAEQLEKLGAAAKPALRKALEGPLSAEARRQVEGLLDRLSDWIPERLQAYRALEVLEHLDTPESRQLLQKLAEGPPEAWLTKEAKAITRRIAPKDKKSP